MAAKKSRRRRRSESSFNSSDSAVVANVERQLARVTDDALILLDTWMGGDDPSAIAGYEYVLAYLAGWCVYVRDGVRAARLLERQHLSAQAAPIRRSMLEHGIACFTIAREPGSFEGVLRAHQRAASKYLSAGEVAGIEGPVSGAEEVVSWVLPDEHRSLDYLTQVKARFDGLDGGGGARLYVAWLEETAMSHATPTTAYAYLRPTDNSDYPTLLSKSRVQVPRWENEAVLADSLLLSLQSLSSITQGDPLKGAISELHKRRGELMTTLYGALDELEADGASG